MRLVAKEFHQKQGLDYIKTFSHVVKMVTMLTFLSITLMNDCSTRQLDVSNVFLHGSLSETVYMQQQPGFTDPNYPFHVCHLQKMIYDLKKSP